MPPRLNQFSLYYDKQLKAREQHKSSDGMGLELGLDNNELSAWIAEGSFDSGVAPPQSGAARLWFHHQGHPAVPGWIDVEYDEAGQRVLEGQGSGALQARGRQYRFQLGDDGR